MVSITDAETYQALRKSRLPAMIGSSKMHLDTQLILAVYILMKVLVGYVYMYSTFVFMQTLQPRLSWRCCGNVSLCSGEHNSF